jgi:hypothetical protein
MLRRTATASVANVFSRNLRLGDYVMRMRPQQKGGRDAIKTMVQQKARTRGRTIMEMPAKQAPAASGEIVKLIRKLRWDVNEPCWGVQSLRGWRRQPVAPGTRAAAMIFASRFIRPSRAAAIASMLCSGTTTAPCRSAWMRSPLRTSML